MLIVFSFKTLKNVYTSVVEDYLWVTGNFKDLISVCFNNLIQKTSVFLVAA